MGTVNAYSTAAGKRYRVRFRKPDHSEGQKRGFRTKRDAELYLASLETQKSRGEFIDAASGRLPVGALGPQWLSTQTQLKPSSLRPIEIAWRLYVQPRWGHVPIGDIRHSDVQQWISGISSERSATTALRAFGVLASILDTAVRDRQIATNPARGVRLPRKVPKHHRYLTHDEVHALAEASGKHKTLILVLSYTGLRWGEVVGLRVSDFDPERRRLTVVNNAVEVGGNIIIGTPKSHKQRSVPIPAFLLPDVASACDGKQPNDLIFSGPAGGHLVRATRGERTWFKAALADADLGPMTIHDLRHTAASLAVSSGANVKAVQRMLGHASAAMTLDVYADLFEDDLDTVAERLNDAALKSIAAKMRPNEH
jgi:integrase